MNIFKNEKDLKKQQKKFIDDFLNYSRIPANTQDWKPHHGSFEILNHDENSVEFNYLSKRFIIRTEIHSTTGFLYARTYHITPDLGNHPNLMLKSANWADIIINTYGLRNFTRKRGATANVAGQDVPVDMTQIENLGPQYFQALTTWVEHDEQGEAI